MKCEKCGERIDDSKEEIAWQIHQLIHAIEQCKTDKTGGL